MSSCCHIFKLIILIAACLSACLLFSSLPISPKSTYPTPTSLFSHVNDVPVVTSLEDYYTLLHEGQVVIKIGDESYILYWDDLSTKEKQELGLMLRVP